MTPRRVLIVCGLLLALIAALAVWIEAIERIVEMCPW